MELVAPVITAILGFLGGLITPLVRHKVRAAEELQAARRSKIEEWRVAIEEADFNDEQALKVFANTSIYSSLRQRMRSSVIEEFEQDRTIYVGGGRGNDVRRHMLLDEVARLEREWKLL
ncbi:hypothetical protein [Chromohalobacter japonicus]|uniref:hypothetical protein n=1 Tax=Chromohalobacter japonicus TaxID=223900 RepID=UPI001FF3CDED|nr:hypothetical protein [Chromohalobacter japonicus]MCK0754394.1 hypothetical protein [Chromohalobacter japonicus]